MDEPRISLCQLTFPDTTFEEDVGIAQAVGAQGISVDESKLEEGREVEQHRLMQEAELGAAICAPSILSILPLGRSDMFPGPEDPGKRIEEMLEGIGRLAAFQPTTIFCVTGPAGAFGEAEARSIVVEGMRALGEAATAAGTRFSFEPMRESFRPEWTIVSSLSEGLDILEEVGREDVGIVFDTWHLWDSPQVHKMIPEVSSRIHGVQVADYRDPTRGWLDRVAAGEGVAGVPLLLAELEEAGYDDWYDMEVFSDDGRFGADYEDSLWKLDPRDFAERQVEGFLRTWRERPRSA